MTEALVAHGPFMLESQSAIQSPNHCFRSGDTARFPSRASQEISS